MVQPARCETQAGLKILGVEIRKFLENLLSRQSRREKIEHVRDSDAHATNAGAPPALLGIDGDTVGQLHDVTINKKTRVSASLIRFQNGAQGRTRTGTGFPTRPSNVRVYQFRHLGSGAKNELLTS